MRLQILYNMYKKDMALNNLQELICHKTQSNFAQSAGAVEYTDFFAAEGEYSSNECPAYDTKQSESEVLVMLELWGMLRIFLMPSLQGTLWIYRVLSMGQIELSCVLMLNWIARNRIVLILKLRTYAKLSCLKWNWFCMLNWIAWIRTVWLN